MCARVCRHVGMWCTCLRIARIAPVNQARIPEQVTWNAEHSILPVNYILQLILKSNEDVQNYMRNPPLPFQRCFCSEVINDKFFSSAH